MKFKTTCNIFCYGTPVWRLVIFRFLWKEHHIASCSAFPEKIDSNANGRLICLLFKSITWPTKSALLFENKSGLQQGSNLCHKKLCPIMFDMKQGWTRKQCTFFLKILCPIVSWHIFLIDCVCILLEILQKVIYVTKKPNAVR